MRQLQLQIEPQLDACISDFSGPSWAGVVDVIRQLHSGLIDRLYVYGEAGTGKSHLLSAICDLYLETGRTAIQVSLLELLDAPIEALSALEHYDLVALDDIEMISGVIGWQKAIFHLINHHHQFSGQLIFSSREAPISLKLQLPDLQSRLTQAVSVRLPNGSLHADRVALVDSVLSRRGVVLDPQIIDYLLESGPHQTSLLLQMLDRLENVLHGEKTKLSAATLKQIYALIDEYKQV
ncbi:DnaA regulatory inactivator Hda [Acinetobacter rathckeae]|uniref:DnaA regulatory inactivator Hda n=1 Tax=Acinetobacter rathckeae TaxID=2605272 RepID=UPI0018A2D9C2|nr:DnaA regulatory inactivator Hda [Acinetobacter rathckeae]MBF7687509.1 DnaA regulatory inactivator Hda [Acinetobacter rathckeae]MBF7694911.1 DnaA regulatory inactivator Hda [Acinetobacter rathckeae]